MAAAQSLRRQWRAAPALTEVASAGRHRTEAARVRIARLRRARLAIGKLSARQVRAPIVVPRGLRRTRRAHRLGSEGSPQPRWLRLVRMTRLRPVYSWWRRRDVCEECPCFGCILPQLSVSLERREETHRRGMLGLLASGPSPFPLGSIHAFSLRQNRQNNPPLFSPPQKHYGFHVSALLPPPFPSGFRCYAPRLPRARHQAFAWPCLPRHTLLFAPFSTASHCRPTSPARSTSPSQPLSLSLDDNVLSALRVRPPALLSLRSLTHARA